MQMKVELLYFDGCPNWRTADERLRELATEYGFQLGRRLVTTPEEARMAGFRGSPTILIDGRDPFASGDEPFSLSCRVYRTPAGIAGAPSIDQRLAEIDARIVELEATRARLRTLARRAAALDPADCRGFCSIIRPSPVPRQLRSS